MRWRRAAISLLVAGSIASCSAVVGESPAVPQLCGEVYSAQTCLAMTDEAASRSHRTRDDVTAIDIVQFPTRDQNGALITRSGGGFFARLTFTDGTTRDEAMCGGIPSGPACMDAPQLRAQSIVEDGGYHDVPCPDGSPPATCGTPLPTLQPAAIEGARPLSLARFEIPIDHVGAYEVPLGEVSFPNGIATAASFGFADPWPLDVSLKDGVAQINLRSLEPDGKPFQNYFDHGWRPGAERAEALLAFEVLWFKKSAVLHIRDVVVH